MPSTIRLVASETLMCGLKSIPIAGKAVEVVDAVRTRRELLEHGDRLAEVEGQMTRMERGVRDLVVEEIRATLEQLGQPGLNGRMLDEEIRNLRQIQEQGWEPALFEGLLRNSSHLEELRRNPRHYGQVLDRHDQLDPSKIHLLIDADPLRILELVPFAFAALLANQDQGVPTARIESSADVWAFPGADGASPIITPASPPQIEAPGRPTGAQVAVPRSAASAIKTTPKSAPEPRFTNSLGMTMVRIEPGDFLMGSSTQQIDTLMKQFPNLLRSLCVEEQPQHPVRITRLFYLGTHPVTVGQFRRFVEFSDYDAGNDRRNPGFRQGDDHPVVNVSHDDAVAFLGWLNQQETGRGWNYRLPTEAEWEYACRAGGKGVYGRGDDPAELDGVAWYSKNSGDSTHPVGQKKKNAFHLYDMLGNVWEWCDDVYDSGYYQSSPKDDPHNQSEAPRRAFRGGCWRSVPGNCRPAYRGRGTPGFRSSDLGFRLAAVQASG